MGEQSRATSSLLGRGIQVTFKSKITDVFAVSFYPLLLSWLPHQLENLEKFQSGILSRLEKSGNYSQNSGKIKDFYTKNLQK